MQVFCQSCKWSGSLPASNDWKRFVEFMGPGDVVPYGECPECGAACHPKEDPADTAELAPLVHLNLLVSGGLGSNISDSLQALVRDRTTWTNMNWARHTNWAEWFEQAIAITEGRKIVSSAPTIQKPYRRLCNFLSDMIDGERLTEADIPDDYDAIFLTLQECNAANEAPPAFDWSAVGPGLARALDQINKGALDGNSEPDDMATNLEWINTTAELALVNAEISDEFLMATGGPVLSRQSPLVGEKTNETVTLERKDETMEEVAKGLAEAHERERVDGLAAALEMPFTMSLKTVKAIQRKILETDRSKKLFGAFMAAPDPLTRIAEALEEMTAPPRPRVSVQQAIAWLNASPEEIEAEREAIYREFPELRPQNDRLSSMEEDIRTLMQAREDDLEISRRNQD